MICQAGMRTAGANRPVWSVYRPRRGAEFVVRAQMSTKGEQEHVKSQIFAYTAPLDKGMGATLEDARRIKTYVDQIEERSSVVRLDDPTVEEELLAGRWKLLYSSEFVPGNAKNPGNAVRPGEFSPVKIGSVMQMIDAKEKRLDNVVDLEVSFSLANILRDRIETPRVIACLGHSYSISGARTMRITYDRTTLQPQGGIFSSWVQSIPELTIPSVLNFLDDSFRSSSFDVVFLDRDLRITRGDRNELRIFISVS